MQCQPTETGRPHGQTHPHQTFRRRPGTCTLPPCTSHPWTGRQAAPSTEAEGCLLEFVGAQLGAPALNVYSCPSSPPDSDGVRAVAQFGSASDWGSGGRRFESCQPDKGLCAACAFALGAVSVRAAPRAHSVLRGKRFRIRTTQVARAIKPSGMGREGCGTMSPVIRYRTANALCVQDDHVLLVHQNTRRGAHWSLPGGKLEGHEPAPVGLTREFAEETGLTSVTVRKLRYLVEAQADAVWFTTMVFDVAVTDTTGLGRTPDVGGEVTEARFVPLADASAFLGTLAGNHAREPLLEHLTGTGTAYYHYEVPDGSDDFAHARRTTAL